MLSGGLHSPTHPSAPRPTADSGHERVSAEELSEFRRQLALLASSTDVDDLWGASIPRRIGRFEIQKEIGSGSFGTVYLAYDPKMSRTVAVKVAHVGSHASEQMRKRFLTEAHAAARMA